MPNKFIFSLRIVIACLYHGMQEGTVLRVGLEAYDPRLHLMEQHPTVFKMFALALFKIFSNVWVDWLL